MKGFFILIAVFVFYSGHAQSNLLVQSTSNTKATSFKGRLIQDTGIRPYLGMWTGIIPLKFKVIDPYQLGGAEEIREVYFFGSNICDGIHSFKKDDLFYIGATSINIDWRNLFNKEKSNREVVNKEAWLCKSIAKTL